MSFIVKARRGDIVLTANAETAKGALEQFVEWHFVQGWDDITISDDSKVYTIAELALAMALLEIDAIVKRA